MIRLYEYSPRLDDDGAPTEAYRDFQNYLFSHPYSFLWDFPADKVVIHNVAYRISSLRRIPDGNLVTCLCLCDGSGNGGSSGGSGISKLKTDVSLYGEGNDTNPLGVQLSQLAGNRLQILDDGCFVGSEPLPYTPPEVALPIYCGVAKSMTLTEPEILAETPHNVSDSSFTHIYGSFKKQHLWVCCPEIREIKSISDENGLSITAAFKKTAIKITLSGEENNYSLYVFDTKTTGSNYKLTFNF